MRPQSLDWTFYVGTDWDRNELNHFPAIYLLYGIVIYLQRHLYRRYTPTNVRKSIELENDQNAVNESRWTAGESARDVEHLLILDVLVRIPNLIFTKSLLIRNFFLSFAMPTFFKGRKKTLDENDLYRALQEHKSGKFC